MCQAIVYLFKDGETTELMRDVIAIEHSAEGLRLESFFGPPLVVQAAIRHIDLLKHTVTLVPTTQTEQETTEKPGEEV